MSKQVIKTKNPDGTVSETVVTKHGVGHAIWIGILALFVIAELARYWRIDLLIIGAIILLAMWGNAIRNKEAGGRHIKK